MQLLPVLRGTRLIPLSKPLFCLLSAVLLVMGGVSGRALAEAAEHGSTATATQSMPPQSALHLADTETLPGSIAAPGRIVSASTEGPTASASVPVGPDPGKGFVRLPGHVLDVLPRATIESASGQAATTASDTSPMILTLVLKRDDQPGFDHYLANVYDPNSKDYHHFLSQPQLADRFGPSRHEYDDVLHYLRQAGFRLQQGSANRLTLTVLGSRAAAERAFRLPINDYSLSGQHFHANATDPALPRALAGRVKAIAGLSDFARPRAARQALAELTAVLVCTILFLPSDLASRYNEDPDYFKDLGICISTIKYWVYNGGHPWVSIPSLGIGNKQRSQSRVAANKSGVSTPRAVSTDGTGQTVGLIEFDTFEQSDVADYLSLVGLDPTLINNVSVAPVNGGAAAGSNQGEVLMDIDAVLSLAPGAKVAVYEAPFTGAGSSFQAVLNAAINGGSTVISNSWAYCEDQTTLADVQSIDTILQNAAAAGISVLTGSGDAGSTCLDGSANTVAVPADSPNITAVGGSSIINGPGFTYQGETWWDGSQATPPTGQGGYGVSKFFPRPSYQNSLNNTAGRSVPDVVINADPANGVELCEASGGGCPNGTLNGGTSLAAPVWAAYVALLNQAHGKNLGALNPLLYPLGSTPGVFHTPANLSSDFAHVGLGSPNFNLLSLALNGQTAGPVDATQSQVGVYLSATPGAPAPTGVSADGKSPAYVVVRTIDANGNMISGKTVAVSTGTGQATVTPSSAVTSSADGSAVFTVTDTTPETLTVTATDTTDGITLIGTPTLPFNVPPAASAGISAAPSTVNADGQTAATITVIMKDASNKPTPGKSVNILDAGAQAVITAPTPAVTDANGQIQFTATDTVNETVTFTAVDVTDGNVPVPGSATVTFSNAATSDCTANPATGANGYVVTTFASGFPAGDFFYSNINLSGCPGADNPFFDSSGTVLIPDFHSGDVYQLGLSGGAVTSGNVLTNLDPSIGTPVVGKDGNLYASRFATGGGFTTGDVVQIDPTTGAVSRELATGLTCPNSLVVDPLSGDLFFDDQCTGAGSDNPSIWRVANPSSTAPAVSVYATLPVGGGQQQLAFAPNGTLYAVSGGAGNPTEVVQVSGTNGASPATVTQIPGLAPDNGAIAVGLTNADGSAKTLLIHVTGNNGGSLETVDITTSPPTVDTVLATGDIGTGVVGPDGCYYVGAHYVVYKLAPASGGCTLTPTSPAPALTLSPASAAPSPTQGTSQTFTATLKNSAPIAGVPVVFQVTGANQQVQQVRTDANGNAAFTYTGLRSGTDAVIAMAAATSNSTTVNVTSNLAQAQWAAGAHVTYVSLNASATSGTVGSTVNVTASLTDSSVSPTAPLAGQTINFSVGTATCSGTTGTNGVATCALTPPAAGNGTLTASFGGSSQLTASQASTTFNTLASAGSAPSVTISVSPSTVAAGGSATLTWSSSNAASCTASGAWSGSQPTSGSQGVTAGTSASYTYTLNCTGAGGTTSALAVLSVNMTTVSVKAKGGGGAIDLLLTLILGLCLLPKVRKVVGLRGLVTCVALVVGGLGMGTARADTQSPSTPDWMNGFYVGLRAGDMPLHFDAWKVDQKLAASGYSAVRATGGGAAVAGTFYVGYSLAAPLDLELGYTRRNSEIATVSGMAPPNTYPLLQDVARGVTGYGSIYSLSLRGHWELVPRLFLTPRVGGYFWDSRVTAETADDDLATATHRGGGFTAGLGAAYRVWRGLELGIGADYFRGSQDNTATLFGASVEWRFGR
jgi:Pro-kumamolisin, activation domain/Bacterial Ig-like domain (group 1)